MSNADPENDRAEDLTRLYRAANATDADRPGDAVRQSILAHARTVARDHAAHASMKPARRGTANHSSWAMAAAASVVVAGFATLLAWHLHPLTPQSSRQTVRAQPKVAEADQRNQTAAAAPESAAGSTESGALSEPAPTEELSGRAPAPNACHSR